MELHELQKMISIIHDKKPRCRGNLRVKVLLKSTHDYVRRSLIDDQLGNSESLMTLLRNSGTVTETMVPINTAHETGSNSMNSDETVHADSDSMDYEQSPTVVEKNQESQCSGSNDLSMKHVSENVPTTNEAFNNNQTSPSISAQSVSVSPSPDSVAFKNSNKTLDKNNNNYRKKYSKLIRALEKIMKQWELITSKVKCEKSCFEYQYQSIKRMRKLLLESKICFKADFENLSFAQQRLNQMYVKVIKKMLKECDRILGYK